MVLIKNNEAPDKTVKEAIDTPTMTTTRLPYIEEWEYAYNNCKKY